MIQPVESTNDKCCCCISCNTITDTLSKVINDIFTKMIQDDRRRGERRERNNE